MVAFPIPPRVKPPFVPFAAIAAGSLVAAFVLFVPTPLLESMVSASGIPAILPAAEPPLGATARMALSVTAGAGTGALAWLAAFLLADALKTMATRRASRRSRFAAEIPTLRRADAHPDAPARAPLRAARDLGAPFLDIRAPKAAPVERDLPRDLDTPLATFDPDAIPDVPAEPVPVAAPLARLPAIQAEGERFESFELPRPAPVADAPPPIAAPRTDASVHALLDRLERGIGKRAETDPAPTGDATRPPRRLDDTLAELRRLAVR